VDTGVAEQLISAARWAVRLFARPPASTSLALDRFCHVSRRLQHIARPDLLIILFA
jgi:hypothetical protein